MIEKLRALITKYWDVLSYLFFGGLTTVVDFIVSAVVYYPMMLTAWSSLAGTVSSVVAWVAAVAFAYLTNKPFVFKSHDWSAKTVFPELGKFVGCRVGSGLLQIGFMTLMVDVLRPENSGEWYFLLMKIIISILVVILNYIGSKLLVFRNKTKKEE